MGFLIVKSLAAGGYDLLVTALAESAPYAVHVEEVVGTMPFADDALASCAIEAGWATGRPLTELECLDRGVESLTGLEVLTEVVRLDLANNEISDLSPLADFTGLRRLSLDGNPVDDLAPLALLASLRRLSLSGVPMDADQLPLLTALAAQLTHLDLSGASTLSRAQAEQLRQASPGLVLIFPDGSVLE